MTRLAFHDHRPLVERLKALTASPWGFSIFCIFALWSLWGNILTRLTKHRPWMNDFDAILCAADYVKKGLSPYGLEPQCLGLHPAPYVYAPQVAQAFVPLVDLLGFDGLRLIWAGLMILSLGTLLWVGIFKRFEGIDLRVRLLAYTALTGSALSCGNISLLMSALITILAFQLPKHGLRFSLCILVMSLIKPVYLTYLILPLIVLRPQENTSILSWGRLRPWLWAGVSGLIGIGLFLFVKATSGPLGPLWLEALDKIVLKQNHSIGLMTWLHAVGLEGSTNIGLAIMGLYGLSLLGLGFALCRALDLKSEAAILWGLGLAMLLNPRLMDYDMVALAPFWALLLEMNDHLAKSNGQKDPSKVPFQRLYEALVLGVLALSLLLNLADIDGLKAAPVALFGLWILVMVLGLRLINLRPEILSIRWIVSKL